MTDADADKADTLKLIIPETQRFVGMRCVTGWIPSLHSASKPCTKRAGKEYHNAEVARPLRPDSG